jgi:hypothetical protein
MILYNKNCFSRIADLIKNIIHGGFNNMKKKRLIAVFFVAALMISMLSFPAAAYANGSANIYNSMGTRLGFVDMWTNNATTGRILYAQTTGTEKYSYIAGQALVKGMSGWSTSFIQTEIKSSSYAQYSPVAILSIPDAISPIDARCIGGINTYIVGLCRQYNNGQGGDYPCSDGASCTFPSTLINQ